jgi:hypothetical protein
MNHEQVNLKTSATARQLLRLIAATTGEKQYEVLERVLRRELASAQQAASVPPAPPHPRPVQRT